MKILFKKHWRYISKAFLLVYSIKIAKFDVEKIHEIVQIKFSGLFLKS